MTEKIGYYLRTRQDPHKNKEHWLQCPSCGKFGRVRFSGVPLTETPANGKQVILHGSTRLAVDWYLICPHCDRDVPIPAPTFH